jgi:hypothetical protein
VEVLKKYERGQFKLQGVLAQPGALELNSTLALGARILWKKQRKKQKH